jgi:uncharacterized membrane protein
MSTPAVRVQARLARRAPVRITDEYVDLNDRIAAALTRWVGSMWTVYATLAIVATWMAMATWGPLRTVDRYPFAFMLFLGNVVQLLLCFVILVGQRVLGRTADRRATQTYENAEAIFQEVSGLHDHLVRQDRQLSRGVSLMEWIQHPWIEQHRVQEPPRAGDYAVGVNGRIAAWITARAGSMWAFYAATVFQVGWIGLALAHVLRFDPYPFAFLLFLSSLAQLILMFVIMVGQEVLGLAGDQRSEQTFLNAEAILQECRRLEAHLTAQDRIIESVCTYIRSQVTEQLARAMHRWYLTTSAARGEAPASRAALLPWEELPEEFRESSRDQARHAADKLAAIGCVVVPRSDPGEAFEYRDQDEEAFLARMEHDRWVRERTTQGFVHGPVRSAREHPDLVPWEELSDEVREKDFEFVRELPNLLAEVGFQILRLPARTPGDGSDGHRPGSV